MDNEKLIRTLKSVFEYVGGIAMFIAGLFFVLIADTKLSLNSYWMFIMIVLAAAGGLLFLVAEYQKDKPVNFYILKGLGILLSIGFGIALYVFNLKFVQIPKPNELSKMVFIVSLVITCVGLACQIGNVTINAIKGIEE